MHMLTSFASFACNTTSMNKPWLIPLTALREIAYHLPLRDKLSLASVCQEWRQFVLNNRYMWENVFVDDEDIKSKSLQKLHSLEGLDFIQAIKFDILTVSESEWMFNCIHRILIKQLKIVSLTLCLHSNPGDFGDEASRLIFDIIVKHQSTLECLDLSYSGISLRNWMKHWFLPIA